ncbi:hydroquinone glucosyltransferase-like [Musa acuminata AAA Group]|uniref:hydroquinone glucosyltransferase-like n=1 Tax=Musa acuminata AAA Group TaxID=214697 RepID=UPI0031D02665
MERGSRAPPHVAVMPSPGMGHLIPLSELAKLFVLRHGFTATFIVFSDFSDHAQTAFLDSLPSGFSYVVLPPLPLDDVPPDAHIETRLSIMVERSVPHVRDVLRSLRRTTRLAAYVIDLFCGETLPVAKELGVPHYLLFTTSFMVLSLLLHLPALDQATSCEYRDLPEPVVLPGCVPLRGEDLLHPMQDRTDDAYRCVLNIARRIREVDGILVNSFVDLEPAAYAALKEAEPEVGRPNVHAIGPVIHRGSHGGAKGKECLRWLDEQPPGSVLFVSFGSGGTLSTEQIQELAWGLEASGRRFLWVVRCPSDRVASGAFFHLQGPDDPLRYLPEGFLGRTRGAGLVVPLWVPQVEVLAHAATGGFLTHCGWNSLLESFVHGVPMIAWPLYAEQRTNAVMMADGLGVALRPKTAADGSGPVRREEVAEVARELMEGEAGKKAREKAGELKQAAAQAVAGRDGSSCKALAEVVQYWKDNAVTSEVYTDVGVDVDAVVLCDDK